ncbi:MAG: hypothetical protein ACRDRS_04490 [Pseudonocardiaceae bacterium]
MRGAQSYELLSRLAPHLAGERTLDELVGPLAADQRAMVEGLFGMLTEQRFVVDAGDDEPHRWTQRPTATACPNSPHPAPASATAAAVPSRRRIGTGQKRNRIRGPGVVDKSAHPAPSIS